MKEKKIDLSRIRSYDAVRRSPVCLHRAKLPYDVSLLIDYT
jgi:hypothetical protein